ncbi:hypothetical protein A7X95_05790 [Candidatus Nitrosopelagicus brevis]|uniref:Uncharacterized protein n=1 Tax=Candidatus Nitrosopelagicus brevis TaxID=1410606 RepID=A0A0A7V162_9ARCH|nr:hypothetical protein [Candidatus Nitrosopelagicus brevis]AJA92799.1 hypothetical protein T478_0145 [Candidatus Nitrosopelagicus brevis]MAR69781.1 hypothetical protein [Nitrospina sp.]PTL87403.1 hypothetical protein A7X95_05790 [Candidatus Nitrosopelagicus brevis]
MKNKELFKKNPLFRAWFYFRMGWSTYFAFIFAAINTLTVTFYLAIENYPVLKSVFPTFEIYVIITVLIGIPLLVTIGYAHYKRTKARKAEVDILVETNPYIMRTLVNTDLVLILTLKLAEIIKNSNDDSIPKELLDELTKLQDELKEFSSQRKFRNEKDLQFFKNIDRKW